ncbi:phosphoribosylamine--glycine ligase [Limosilactobacillus ingluviei]|uniref:phosphoribosylamine--glycine ligase n=1 Tax=Limosilactobacillus ingluviei TaxID=148604 RepID=UPI0024B8C632|nr:phosphoribosylamine--glycine ligase [Limosilactobacillus ingluviei]
MSKQNVLVIGAGGREFAIAKALKQSPQVAEVYCAPGNVGMASVGVQTVPLAENDFAGLIDFAKTHQVAWTFVGPETALVDGIVDEFHQAGLKILGPTARAAQLEGSKDYALNFMNKYGVPTAKHTTYDNATAALAAVAQYGFPLVIKANGLEGGKGVVIAPDQAKAETTIKEMFAAGQDRLVLEECLTGPEYSLFVLIENGQYRILPMAQDHKRAYDGDQGPNTGGMGAYSPLPQLAPAERQRMIDEVVEPTIQGLIAGGYHYHGILYIGLMLTPTGPKVIEYNVRLGDPETQVILPRLATDLFELVDACLNDREMPAIEENSAAVLGVVLAAKGYPQVPVHGQALGSFPTAPGIAIDYANVAGSLDALTGAGGRLLMVIGTATELATAQRQVYDYLAQLDEPACEYRHDIGDKALK